MKVTTGGGGVDIPDRAHPARCCQVAYVGELPEFFEGKEKPPQPHAILIFQIPGVLGEYEKDGETIQYRATIPVDCKLMTADRSNFMKMLKGLELDSSFMKALEGGEDAIDEWFKDTFLDKPFLITTKKNDKGKANVKSVGKPINPMTDEELEVEDLDIPTHFYHNDKADMDDFKKLHPFAKWILREKSNDYRPEIDPNADKDSRSEDDPDGDLPF